MPYIFGGDTGRTQAEIAAERDRNDPPPAPPAPPPRPPPLPGTAAALAGARGGGGAMGVGGAGPAPVAPFSGLKSLFGVSPAAAPSSVAAPVPTDYGTDVIPGDYAAPDRSSIAKAIVKTSSSLGIDPIDLATAMSYETGGTFDPWQRGPTTKWGQHRGLIQWGEPQRKQYGVYKGMPVEDQVAAAGKYLTDAGVKPGMGMLDIYSAINAGRVGRYGASDAKAGGAPGTVRDKVGTMKGHRLKAMQMLGSILGVR